MTTDRRDEAPAALPIEGRVLDASRRRLVRSGLAGSVVLGSLVSRPVLGAEYICTPSGHASGNASAHLIDGVNCDFGNDVRYWLDNDWPGQDLKKGSLPDDGCSFTDPDLKGTVFNGYGGLAATFFVAASTVAGAESSAEGESAAKAGGRPKKKSGFFTFEQAAVEAAACIVGTTGTEAATMLQVLATDPSSTDELLWLGRVTVASLLNAAQFGSGYPVNQARIIAMFNAVAPEGGLYLVEGANLKLSRIGVIEYLEKLYTP